MKGGANVGIDEIVIQNLFSISETSNIIGKELHPRSLELFLN
jgi:hypothetical protein